MVEYLESRAWSVAGSNNEGFLLRLWDNWKARRDVRNLQLLNDHQLKDMGLKRSDIFWASQQSLGVNAFLVLEERMLEDRFK